ncbi:MAG TPA: HAMP domain-containing sensor histidine kinase [Solirubrobacteraceae bacterium]
MNRVSLRLRLAVTIALTGALLSTGIALAVYQLDASSRIARARDEQASRVALAAAITRQTGQVVLGATRSGEGVPPALRAAVQRGLLATYHRGDTLWAGSPVGDGGGVYLHASLSADSAALASLRDNLLLVGGLATVAAALLGVLLASTLSRRLRHAARVADEIAAGDLGARVDAAGSDEVARLGHAIDQMTAALAERIAREKRFSADVAHELRTPLTALLHAASMLGEDRPSQIVRERVAALRTLVEDLLEISRLQAGAEMPEARSIDLDRFVRKMVESRAGTNGRQLVIVESGSATQVLADPRRLDRILGNLLDNAIRHGRPPVAITVDGTSVTVRDHGDGYPDALLREGPRPFLSGASSRGTGTGLGLTIAAAQASAIGAKLSLGNALDGGGSATLTLPEPIPAP